MFEIDLTCPYCWQKITLFLEKDIRFDKIKIVEDCTVCCHPIDIEYSVVNNQIKNLKYSAIEGNN